MALGKTSPILVALQDAQRLGAPHLEVILSHRLFERDPVARARRHFRQTPAEALLYVNLRRHQFAWILSPKLAQQVPAKLLKQLASLLEQDFHSTHPERAVALALRTFAALSTQNPEAP